jgi:hypothetical protein
MARTCALFLSFHPALHRLLCSNETIQNVPKHYEMILGSNDVDRLCSLWKIAMWHRGTNLCLIAPFQPVLHLALSINETLPNAPKHYETHQNRVSCSNERFPNAPKHYETHQNRSLGSNWVYRVHSLRKLPMRFHATNLCINSTISAHFASSFVQ